MKRIILALAISVLIMACGGVKRTQESLNTGDYTSAINRSIQRLAENKTKKSNQEFVLLLEEAYQKHTERELRHIAFLEKDGNEANYETIFKTYNNLRNIQERIKPLLPLPLIEENRVAEFEFNDYDNEIIEYKNDLSEYLYDNAENLLNNATSKYDYRSAYEDFAYLDEINPGFEDTKLKMEEAYEKGIHYVKVEMLNNSDQIIPARLSEHLLNFNTFGLNDKWVNFHTNHLATISYDYNMRISLEQIFISPERLSEKQFIKERQVKDGFNYAVDGRGNILKDSLGNKIKVDKFKTVQCTFEQFTQSKFAQVTGLVTFIDMASNQQIDNYPLSSEFIFEHSYAVSNGDSRALDNDLLPLLELRGVPFPTNEQMIFDAGEDLKERIKEILLRQRFNRMVVGAR